MNTDTIICGDNATVLAGFPDACIDLTVTSPPYDDMDLDFNPIVKKNVSMRTYNGYAWNFKGLVDQLYRVTVPGGVVVWVVNDPVENGSESLASSLQKIYFRRAGFNIHDSMIYEKNGSAMPDNVRYLQCFEYMLVLSKGSPKTINLLEDRKNRYTERWGKGQTVREADGSMTARKHRIGGEYGRRFNFWRINNGYGYSAEEDYAYQHPAIFPESLARDHINSWSNPGDIVLDPFIGSGTTAKMAKETGRHFIGIDISEDYCKLARRRVAGANVPLPFFAQVQP